MIKNKFINKIIESFAILTFIILKFRNIGRSKVNHYKFCTCFREKKIEILVSEYAERSKTSRNMIFSWRPNVCVCGGVCMCICARLSNFQTTTIHKRLEISSLDFLQRAPSVVTIFMQIKICNLRFYKILNFLKNVCGSSNFRKI